MSTDKKLIVIVGPTAVGKTAVAIEVAKHFGAEIISADSRQVYKEMELGTAKPDAEELSQVVHHFIDTHSIQEDFSSGEFEKAAIKKIGQLHQKHDYVVMAGGSGLYVKAVTEGLTDMPKVSMEVRQELNHQLEEQGLESLLEELKQADPEYYNQVDTNNPQRVIRALEICRETGQSYSNFRVPAKIDRPFKSIKVGLTMERSKLYARIDLRMDKMIEKGLFEEAESLYDQRNLNALQTVGYSEIFDYIEGKYDKEEAVRLLKRNSRRYAKRQLTWFSKDSEVRWFEPSEIVEIIDYISNTSNND